MITHRINNQEFSISARSEFVATICQIAGDHLWSSSAEQFFSQASKDGNVIKWSDLLDFYINLDKVKTFLIERIRTSSFSGQEKSKATVFQPIHHDGDFKAAQHSR